MDVSLVDIDESDVFIDLIFESPTQSFDEIVVRVDDRYVVELLANEM